MFQWIYFSFAQACTTLANAFQGSRCVPSCCSDDFCNTKCGTRNTSATHSTPVPASTVQYTTTQLPGSTDVKTTIPPATTNPALVSTIASCKVLLKQCQDRSSEKAARSKIRVFQHKGVLLDETYLVYISDTVVLQNLQYDRRTVNKYIGTSLADNYPFPTSVLLSVNYSGFLSKR